MNKCFIASWYKIHIQEKHIQYDHHWKQNIASPTAPPPPVAPQVVIKTTHSVNNDDQFIKPATPHPQRLITFHPSFGNVSISNAYLSSHPGHHGESHLFSMGLREISRATPTSKQMSCPPPYQGHWDAWILIAWMSWYLWKLGRLPSNFVTPTNLKESI